MTWLPTEQSWSATSRPDDFELPDVGFWEIYCSRRPSGRPKTNMCGVLSHFRFKGTTTSRKQPTKRRPQMGFVSHHEQPAKTAPRDQQSSSPSKLSSVFKSALVALTTYCFSSWTIDPRRTRRRKGIACKLCYSSAGARLSYKPSSNLPAFINAGPKVKQQQLQPSSARGPAMETQS